MNAMRTLRVILIGRQSERIRTYFGLMRHFRGQKNGLLARLCSRVLERSGVFVSSNANIGRGVQLPHPTAIVIGEGVTIEDNVTIYQSVTLGGKKIGDGIAGNYPTIREGAVLFSGAVVAGKVTVGKHSIIGANSVVTSDVPDGAVAVGAPARVVGSNTKSE
jgi:serine O-acetyltransferase